MLARVQNPQKVDDLHSLAETVGSPVLFLRTKCLPEIPGALHRPEGKPVAHNPGTLNIIEGEDK